MVAYLARHTTVIMCYAILKVVDTSSTPFPDNFPHLTHNPRTYGRLRDSISVRRRRGVRSSRSCGDTGAPAAARARVIITFCVVPSVSERSASQSAKVV